MSIGEWLVLAVTCGVGVIGLLLAASGGEWIRLLYDRADAVRCRDHLLRPSSPSSGYFDRVDQTSPLMARAAAVWDARTVMPALLRRAAAARAGSAVAQVPLEAPTSRVVDLGCGAGNESPRSCGSDFPMPMSSASMQFGDHARESARDRAALPLRARRLLSVATARADRSAVVRMPRCQWVDRHSTLFPRLLTFVQPGGVFAVQYAWAIHDMLLRRIPYELAKIAPWSEHLRDAESAPGILTGRTILGPVASARRFARYLRRPLTCTRYPARTP